METLSESRVDENLKSNTSFDYDYLLGLNLSNRINFSESQFLIW